MCAIYLFIKNLLKMIDLFFPFSQIIKCISFFRSHKFSLLNLITHYKNNKIKKQKRVLKKFGLKQEALKKNDVWSFGQPLSQSGQRLFSTPSQKEKKSHCFNSKKMSNFGRLMCFAIKSLLPKFLKNKNYCLLVLNYLKF